MVAFKQAWRDVLYQPVAQVVGCSDETPLIWVNKSSSYHDAQAEIAT